MPAAIPVVAGEAVLAAEVLAAEAAAAAAAEAATATALAEAAAAAVALQVAQAAETAAAASRQAATEAATAAGTSSGLEATGTLHKPRRLPTKQPVARAVDCGSNCCIHMRRPRYWPCEQCSDFVTGCSGRNRWARCVITVAGSTGRNRRIGLYGSHHFVFHGNSCVCRTSASGSLRQ
jgi:hypothetical protein